MIAKAVQPPHSTAARRGWDGLTGLVPPAPREPNEAAKELILGYAGRQKIQLLGGALFLIVSCPMSAVFSLGLPPDLALRAYSHPMKATVTGAHTEGSVEINGVNPTVVAFFWEQAGERREGKTTFTDKSPQDFPPGTVVDAEFFPGVPEWSQVKGGTYSTFGLIGLLTLIFPLAGAGLMFAAVRSNRRERRAWRDGIAVGGAVTRSEEETSHEANGKHPWIVEWEFEVDGQKYEGELTHMKQALLTHFKVGAPVTVLYLRGDPRVNTLWVE